MNISKKLQQKFIQSIKKDRYELDNESSKQCNRIFTDEKLTIKVFMDCRTTLILKFRTRLCFKQSDVILTKEQSVLTKIMSLFEGKSKQTQYNVLGYKIDLPFHGNRN